MTRKAKPNFARSRGFTLLELLIAMSLMSLIFAALTGGLRFGTQAWQSTTLQLSNSDDLQLVYRTLRRQLSTLLAAPGSLVATDQESSFEGLRDQLSFVGEAPARSMIPGLFHLKLVLVPDKIGQTLALRWDRLEKTDIQANSDNIEPLLRGLQSIKYTYFGFPKQEETARWMDEWRSNPSLPLLVRITIRFVDTSRTPWPDLIIPVSANG